MAFVVNYQAIAEQWIGRIWREIPGITSADKAYAWMRDHELYAPRRYVRAAWREMIGMYGNIPYIQSLPSHYKIPRRMYAETAQAYKEKYVYRVQIRGRHIETGEEMTKWVTITDDHALTVGALGESGFGFAWVYDFETELITPEISIVGAMHPIGQEW